VFTANVRAVYNIPPGTTCTNPKTSQAAIEFLPVGAPPISDLQKFALQTSETFHNISRVVGPWSENGEDTESALDAEYLFNIGSGANNTYFTMAHGWMYELALALFNLPNPPLVNSISYGWPEALNCQKITMANCSHITTQEYIAESETEFAKLAALGLTVVVATGDYGAPSYENEDCSLDKTAPVWPMYPASSAWVTSVGGTTLVDDSTPPPQPYPICKQSKYPCANGTTEIPCSVNNTLYQYTAGGGFSKWNSQPSFQAAAVNAYLKSGAVLPPSSGFNASNRAYPDISAFGARVFTIMSGKIAIVEGTSCAAPIISGILSLINDWRLNNGKPPLGFASPLLYQIAAACPDCFHDITTGENNCTQGSSCCKYGYGGADGWDAVTGLGSPDFAKILDYLAGMP